MRFAFNLFFSFVGLFLAFALGARIDIIPVLIVATAFIVITILALYVITKRRDEYVWIPKDIGDPLIDEYSKHFLQQALDGLSAKIANQDGEPTKEDEELFRRLTTDLAQQRKLMKIKRDNE